MLRKRAPLEGRAQPDPILIRAGGDRDARRRRRRARIDGEAA
jgi:hypothetical protein